MLSHTALTMATPPRRAVILAMPALLAGTLLAGRVAEATTPFEIADIFFELNATARDVGVHVSLDAESWKRAAHPGAPRPQIIEVDADAAVAQDRAHRAVLRGRGAIAGRGPVLAFLSCSRPGNYSFLGTTTESQLLRSTDRLTTDIPCPVRVLSPQPDEPVGVERGRRELGAAPGVFNPDTRRCNTERDVGLVGYQLIVEVVNEARAARALVPTCRRVSGSCSPAGFIRQAAARRDRVQARGDGDRGQRQQDDHGGYFPGRKPLGV